jgi:periplasmic divalent cation tolerance protein
MTAGAPAGILPSRPSRHENSANPMTEKYILVLCTCPEDVVASRIGTTLVEEHLASCVSRLSRMVSTYWWKGKMETDTEALLMIKTSERLLPRLSKRIEELHPAELPEVITLPITGGSERYLEWLGQNLAAIKEPA